MSLQPFTSNFEDNSTNAGFQFTFYCDLCREGYKTGFIESKTYKKGKFFKGLGSFVDAASQVTGGRLSNASYGMQRGSDAISQKFEGMTPDWHKEHEKAFEVAQNEAKGHFQRCPRCKKYVCENDWNEQEGLCVEEAPRESTEVAAARAEKMAADIRAKASKAEVFTGEIESRQTLCPECGKPAGKGKFCNNCGKPLGLSKCPKCGAPSQAGARFCGECGAKFE